MAGNPEQALKLAKVALAIDPSHLLAREVSGFASAELKQQAEKEARVATAARHLEEAKQHVGRGKFQKARALVSAATHLDPANNQYEVVLAWIHEEEARAAAEAERRILARRLAIAVAPILERAREAEAHRDYLRAAWTAENALAVDPECAEAKEIRQRAREQLEAQPQLADSTVDFSTGNGQSVDPDATVSFRRPTSLWGRLTDVFRRWTRREPTVARQPDDSPRAKTLPG